LGNALACRFQNGSVLDIRAAGNPWMWSAILLTFLLQLAVVYIPPLQSVFHTCSLTFWQLSVCVAVSLIVFAVIELVKLFR
jgi:Ca2+-transporting ATPase